MVGDVRFNFFLSVARKHKNVIKIMIIHSCGLVIDKNNRFFFLSIYF